MADSLLWRLKSSDTSNDSSDDDVMYDWMLVVKLWSAFWESLEANILMKALKEHEAVSGDAAVEESGGLIC